MLLFSLARAGYRSYFAAVGSKRRDRTFVALAHTHVDQRVVQHDLVAVVEIRGSAVVRGNAVPSVSELGNLLAQVPSCDVCVDAGIHQVSWRNAVLFEFRQVDGVDSSGAVVQCVVGVFGDGMSLATRLNHDDRT